MDEKGITADLRRTYIQTLSAISRSGGYRLGKQLEIVVPLVLQQCSPAKAKGDAEMCEACLQAFDSFVLRCPKEVTTFQKDITKTALQYISCATCADRTVPRAAPLRGGLLARPLYPATALSP